MFLFAHMQPSAPLFPTGFLTLSTLKFPFCIPPFPPPVVKQEPSSSPPPPPPGCFLSRLSSPADRVLGSPGSFLPQVSIPALGWDAREKLGEGSPLKVEAPSDTYSCGARINILGQQVNVTPMALINMQENSSREVARIWGACTGFAFGLEREKK